jgi:hypothetical protein
MHKDNERVVVHEEGGRQVPYVFVLGRDMALRQREEPLLQRQDLVDQLCAAERRGIASPPLVEIRCPQAGPSPR